MRLLIASSATGGHIYPALSVADGVRARDADAAILFVGAKWEIGRNIVENAGYEQVFIDASGFDRGHPLNNIKTIRDLIRSSGEIRKILKAFKPDVALGTGGHVAGPVIRGAKRAGVRAMIQEQNVVPGMANRLAAKYADRIFTAFDDSAAYFRESDRKKLVTSGNPVRAAFAEASAARNELRARYGVGENDFCVLIFGGSQGAGAINEAAVEAAGTLLNREGFHLILITGRDYFTRVSEALSRRFPDEPKNLSVMAYSDAIYELFAVSDLVVSRAGASTVTEIAASGKASILVPSPNVTNNHQYYNAKMLADSGAASLLDEAALKDGGLAAEITRFATSPGMAAEMGGAASAFARADAVRVIVDEIFGD